MKIYNKKSFFFYLFLLLSYIALFVYSLRRDGSVSFLQVCTFLIWLFISGRMILRSLSKKHAREDLVLARDERNRHIWLKSAQWGLQITQVLCFIGGLALYYFSTDNYDYLLLGSGLLIALAISVLAEIVVFFYYYYIHES